MADLPPLPPVLDALRRNLLRNTTEEYRIDATRRLPIASALDALAYALEPLAKIADAWRENGLDEDRPDWRARNVGDALPFAEVELYSGRGGRRLLTLANAFAAEAVLGGAIPSKAEPIPPAPAEPLLTENVRVGSVVIYAGCKVSTVLLAARRAYEAGPDAPIVEIRPLRDGPDALAFAPPKSRG